MTSKRVFLPALLFAVTGSALSDTAFTRDSIRHEQASCGIADLDRIRIQVASDPTDPSNVQSRRAALYRWWRLLWHQGYDMSMNGYDTAWEKVLTSSDGMAFKALDEAYAALEDISANGRIIEEIVGSPMASDGVTRTNWPSYHGTDGSQTGYSPDTGPSRGKVAWRIAKGNFWYATPVIDDGRIYTASPGADVIAYCLSEKTGEVIWNCRQFGTQVYATPGSIFSPVVSPEKVVVTTGWWQPDRHFVLNRETGVTEAQVAAGNAAGGHANQFMVYKHNRWNVVLADATTGKGIWTFQTGGNLSGEPVLNGNEIYAARQSGWVFRLGTASNKPVWQRDLGTQLRGTPALGSGQMYLGDKQRTLHALSAADGASRWEFEAPASEFEPRAYQFFSSATEAKVSLQSNPERVYVGTAGSYLYCLNASSGDLIWKHKLSDWIRSKPLVIGDTVYVATLDSKLFALRDIGSSAQVQWQTQLGEHGFTADLVGNENGILASGMDLVLYSVSPDTGMLQWRHSLIDGAWIAGKRHQADVFAGQFQSSPVVVDGIVYIGGPDGFLSAHAVGTGKRLWRFEARGRISATPCVAEGKVFVGQNGRYMEYYAIDQMTGEPVWSLEDLGWATVGSTAYHDGRIFVGTGSGSFYGIDAGSGRILWRHQSRIPDQGFHPPPATDDAKVYTGSHDGRYYALSQVDGSVIWSMDTSTKPNALSGGNPDSAGIVLWKDHAYVQKQGSVIVALNRETGKEVWAWRQPANFLQNGTVAAHDNKVFGSVVRDVTAIPYYACIHAFQDVDHGGGELWSYAEAGGGGGLTAPVVTEDKLIFGSSAGVFMTCLNPDTGALKWRCYVGGPMEEGVPALYGNKVFSHHRNGYFFAIE